MADTVAHWLPTLRKHVPDFLESSTLRVGVDDRGRVHRERGNSYSGIFCRDALQDVKAVSLNSLKPSTACDMCLRTRWGSGAVKNGDLLEAIIEMVRLNKKHSKDPSGAAAILRGVKYQEAGLKALRKARAGATLSIADDLRMDTLESTSESILTSLQKLLSSDEEKLAQLAFIRENLEGSDADFDTTPTLTGVYPYVASRWTKFIQGVVAQNRMHKDYAILLLPRYAADWLLMEGGSGKGLLLSTSAEGLSLKQIETAAGIFEPNTPLQSLKECVATARGL